MADDWAKLRIDHSRRVLDGWESIGRPSGNLEDLLDMVRQEIEVLERMALYDEEWSIQAHFLAGRYRAFREGLKSMAD